MILTGFTSTPLPLIQYIVLEANLTTSNYLCAAIQSYTNPVEIYVLGGISSPTNIGIFNMADHTVRNAGDLVRRYHFSGAVADGTGSAILVGNDFNDDYIGPGYPAARINLTSKITTYGTMPLPFILGTPAVVWDGAYAYVIGGYRNLTAGHFPHSIIKIDPTTLAYSVLPVSNFPGNATDRLMYISAVFVERLNRIYFFGGSASRVGLGDRDHDSIWYIELSPPAPTTTPARTTPEATTPEATMTTTEPIISTTTMRPDIFTCADKLDGMYPHPADCAKFINCNDNVTTVFDCPEPVLFDVETRRCVHPHLVDCLLSCVGREDEMYPHPYYSL